MRVARLIAHPLHGLRAAVSFVGGRPRAAAARRTWRRLWFEERPLSDVPAFDAAAGEAVPLTSEAPRVIRVSGSARQAIVLTTPSSRVWHTRSAANGELRVWCAVMPAFWSSRSDVRISLRVSGSSDRTASLVLRPARSWGHRRWSLLRLPIAGAADIAIEVASDGVPIEVAIGDAEVRWRRPSAEVRALARAFFARLAKGGLRDTARWAERSSRQREDQARYRTWCDAHTPDAHALAAMARGAAAWTGRPRFSILTPVYNTDPAWLDACIESVRAQVYPDWELVLSDDGSTREETKAVLRAFESDPRIRVIWNEQNRGIAGATQAALDSASGDFIAMLDHDDALLPHALYRMAARLRTASDADMLYSDEDKLELDGSRSDAYFKPDWSPDLFLSSMYVCHFLVMRRSAVIEAGGFRPGYDGSQDYDLVLRVIERARRIEHVSDVLYHWRKIPQSASSTGAAKPWAHLAGQRALQDYANRNQLDAAVEDAGAPGLYRMRYRLRGTPLVSVIITASRGGSLDPPAVRSSYPHRETIVVVPPGTDVGADRSSNRALTIVESGGDEAERLNAGAAAARGACLLFLGADVEPKHADWIEAMLEHAGRPQVGAVGAKLFYPDGRLRHIGLVVGPDGVGRRSFDGYPGTWAGYFSNANAIHNRLAVSRAAILLPRAAFERIGGWRMAPDLDVDLGWRLHEAGLRVVFTPYARLTEHQAPGGAAPASASRARGEPGRLDRDPYYNLHFVADGSDYEIQGRGGSTNEGPSGRGGSLDPPATAFRGRV